MDVREKLVELLVTADDYENSVCRGYPCKVCQYKGTDCTYKAQADYLIANRVTVQEWISVKDRLPQDDLPFGALCEIVQVLLDDGTVTVGWCNRGLKCWYYMPINAANFVGHDYENTPVVAWQPLAQPPKGE